MMIGIFPNDEGFIAILYKGDTNRTLLEVCKSDIPAGRPFLIIDDSELPDDNGFLLWEAWEADFSNPDGYGERVDE
jgi:hypothetical protein